MSSDAPEDGPPPPRPPGPGAGPAADPLLGALVEGRYRVVAPIARGGMGCVYRAVEEPGGRPVALKTLLPHLLGGEREATLHKRLMREAATCARLSHPNTVRVHGFGGLTVAGDDTLYLVMELVEGTTLARTLAAEGPFPPARTLRVAAGIAEALGEAHGIGVVHRDLKPSNVMLVGGAGSSAVKVLDFGVAKVVQGDGENLTSTGSFIGSPRYTAPEQVRQEDVDGRCDLYALGCVMYELLSGKPPFATGEPMRTLLSHLHEPVPPLRDRAAQPIPEALESLVLRCLEKDRDARWADAGAFLRALREVQRELDPEAAASAAPGAPPVGATAAESAVPFAAAEPPEPAPASAPTDGVSPHAGSKTPLLSGTAVTVGGLVLVGLVLAVGLTLFFR
jgi:serine/threonine protein kinase